MDDEVLRYTVEVDAAEKTVTLSPAAEGAPKVVLAYTEPEVGQVTLEGSFEDQAIRVRLGRVDHSKGLLLSRGFHWVSEYPLQSLRSSPRSCRRAAGRHLRGGDPRVVLLLPGRGGRDQRLVFEQAVDWEGPARQRGFGFGDLAPAVEARLVGGGRSGRRG